MASIPRRLSERHQAVARLIAAGRRRSEIAAMIGYAPWTISAVRRAPGFADLVSGYQREIFDAALSAIVRRPVGPSVCPRCGGEWGDSRVRPRATPRAGSVANVGSLASTAAQRSGTSAVPIQHRPASPSRALHPEPVMNTRNRTANSPTWSPETIEVLRRLNAAPEGPGQSFPH